MKGQVRRASNLKGLPQLDLGRVGQGARGIVVLAYLEL